MHPELGFEEVETSKLVAGWLEKFGIEVKRGVAKTGVVGLLKGKKPGKDRGHPGGYGCPAHGGSPIRFPIVQGQGEDACLRP